jgi:hypothetical protein
MLWIRHQQKLKTISPYLSSTKRTFYTSVQHARIESFTLTYSYQRRRESEAQVENGVFISRTEINIIDLGLIAPDGSQVGTSGSDKLSVFISETSATPGYYPCKLTPGEWQIIVGAYKVAEEGVDVLYELAFTPKHLRLLKGDLHTHTFASDGVLSIGELALHAARNELPRHHGPQPAGIV